MANGLFNLKQVMQAVQQGGWPAQKPPAVEYLVVSGGGGAVRGGGGAGGLLTGLDPVPNGQTLLVTVGAGGTGRAISGTTPGGIGGSSVFGAISPTGGGGGATDTNVTPYQINNVGQPGGSGGGGGSSGAAGIFVGGQGTAGQGNAGGSNGGFNSTPYPSGGGGGAGTVGLSAATTNISGYGGAGISSSIIGTATVYAGGGGGGNYDNTGTAGAGGAGGGGAGSTTGSGSAGTANTGGGGGGGPAGGNGGNGGSGIVIVSYSDVYAAATSTTGSPTVSTSGSGGIAFNGTSQSLNYNAQTPFAFGTGDFTIELWAYITGGLSDAPSYVDFRGSNSQSLTPTFYNNNGTLTYYTAGAAQITAAYSTLNAWAHLAVCRIGTVTKMYVNGTQVGSSYTDTNNYVVGTGGPFIGQNGVGGGWLTGYMSNIRIVKGVGVYTGTFTPTTAPLTITQPAGTNIAAITGTQTSLLLPAMSGAISADISTNAYAVASTTVASPTWNAASPFTGAGYKNRVYRWTSSGSITF
jgi:hypothetical protein